LDIKYFGTSIPFNDIPNNIKSRGVNLGGAARKREMYLLNIFSQIKNIKNLHFITPAYGKKGGIFNSIELDFHNRKHVFLGYIGKGIIRIFTSHIYSFFWVIRNVKAGDTVITYNFPPIYAIPILLKKIFIKFRLIIEFEDFYNKDDKRYYFFRPFENLGIQFANSFIASSVGMSNYINENRKQAQIIINGGYFEDINTKLKKNNLSSSVLKILYSGTLDKERGIHNLIKLFQSNKSEKFELIFSGSGPLEEYIKEKSAEDPRINFVGLLSDEEYNFLIMSSQICVNPQWASISVNFPSKITMYLSYGKTVLSTRIESLINSPYKDLILFYDELSTDDFWDKLYMISDNSKNFESNKSERIVKFKKIIDAQKDELIKLICE